MLDNELTPKTSPSTYKGGSIGHKAFIVAELVLLKQCVDKIGFEGGDVWVRVVEKFNQECHVEWPEQGLNSLKKKFMEVWFIVKSTGATVNELNKTDGQFKAQDR